MNNQEDLRIPYYSKKRHPLITGSKWFLGLSISIFCIYFFLNFSYHKNVNESNIMTQEYPQETKVSKLNQKPNFVFVLIDDMGYGSIGSDESGIGFATPFINNLASNGIKLSNYYAQEICSPSRAALMTGRYPITLGMQFGEIQPDDIWGLNISEIIFPQLLSDNGYKIYGAGKWNLGHYSPHFLPTARGFDEYIGFLSGEEYHWSKRMPYATNFIDFFYSDKECYAGYDGDDLHEYSTFLYTKKAVNAINNHDYDQHPLFLYLALQAVHDPFDDWNNYPNGLPISYFEHGVYHSFKSNIIGTDRLQYTLSLRLVDNAISEIYQTLIDNNQLENTYIIITSDNGGCNSAGGRNGDLRGSKGTLFEGGVKVDAIIYSPLFPESTKGSIYSGLMHVSDWFPTILDMANISYSPSSDRELDGYSQKDGFIHGQDYNKRTNILYNIYYNVDTRNFNISDDAPFAIRNSRYKLMHTYENNSISSWYDFSSTYDSDDDLDPVNRCNQLKALKGDYAKYLFDLEDDPNETNNLYYNDSYASVINDLYDIIDEYSEKAREDIIPSSGILNAEDLWKDYGNYVLPWRSDTAPLSNCNPKSSIFSLRK